MINIFTTLKILAGIPLSQTFHILFLRKPNPLVTSLFVETISLVLFLTRTSPWRVLVVFVLFNAVQPALLREPNVELSMSQDGLP